MLCRDAAYLIAKIMQTESRIIKSCLNVMPRCRLSYAKIMQTESRIIKLACMLCRDAAYLIAKIMQIESRIIKLA